MARADQAHRFAFFNVPDDEESASGGGTDRNQPNLSLRMIWIIEGGCQ